VVSSQYDLLPDVHDPRFGHLVEVPYPDSFGFEMRWVANNAGGSSDEVVVVSGSDNGEEEEEEFEVRCVKEEPEPGEYDSAAMRLHQALEAPRLHWFEEDDDVREISREESLRKPGRTGWRRKLVHIGWIGIIEERVEHVVDGKVVGPLVLSSEVPDEGLSANKRWERDESGRSWLTWEPIVGDPNWTSEIVKEKANRYQEAVRGSYERLRSWSGGMEFRLSMDTLEWFIDQTEPLIGTSLSEDEWTAMEEFLMEYKGKVNRA
jgi:hypothetical protein